MTTDAGSRLSALESATRAMQELLAGEPDGVLARLRDVQNSLAKEGTGLLYRVRDLERLARWQVKAGWLLGGSIAGLAAVAASKVLGFN